MGRLVLIVLIVLAVIFLVRGFGRRRGGGAGAAQTPARGERMVQCAHCGVFVPEAGAVESGGRHYCSDEHRRLSAK
ncbi:MAG: PP0621 family protein [Burkholderiales bacterium]|nr:PP0621 family protein [Burkholderiales bacterium]